MKIRNLRTFAVEHPETGDPVGPGEDIDVPDDIAGCAPDGLGDLGCGLLAQTKSWAPVKSKRTPAAAGAENGEDGQ